LETTLGAGKGNEPLSSMLFGVVEDDAKRVAGTAVDAAYAVAEIYAVVAARALHGPIAGSEDNRLAFNGGDNFGLGLGGSTKTNSPPSQSWPGWPRRRTIWRGKLTSP
jgi:hypothetical protein